MNNQTKVIGWLRHFAFAHPHIFTAVWFAIIASLAIPFVTLFMTLWTGFRAGGGQLADPGNFVSILTISAFYGHEGIFGAALWAIIIDKIISFRKPCGYRRAIMAGMLIALLAALTSGLFLALELILVIPILICPQVVHPQLLHPQVLHCRDVIKDLLLSIFLGPLVLLFSWYIILPLGALGGAALIKFRRSLENASTDSTSST